MSPESPTTPAPPTSPPPRSSHFGNPPALEEVSRFTTEAAALAATRAAPFWPALLGFAGIVAIYLLLPLRYMAGPRWLLPSVVIALAAVVILARALGRHHLAHGVGVALSAAISLAVAASAALLLAELLEQRITAPTLLLDAALVWVANVLSFALWYWTIDGGGPAQRHRHGHAVRAHADFLFPQWAVETPAARGWTPHFLDYVFLAFNTSTAFSPTDTLVMSRRAKALMMAQSLISLVVIAVLAARAINTL